MTVAPGRITLRGDPANPLDFIEGVVHPPKTIALKKEDGTPDLDDNGVQREGTIPGSVMLTHAMLNRTTGVPEARRVIMSIDEASSLADFLKTRID